jgi:hypothetical protein
MSRSYKKHPGWYDRNPYNKRKASQYVRRFKGEMSDGMFYKRLFDSWDISDHKQSIFGKMDLSWIDDNESHFVPRGQPKSVRCFKELKKSIEYRRARAK